MKLIHVSVLAALVMNLALPMPAVAASPSIPHVKGGIGSPGPSSGANVARGLVAAPAVPPPPPRSGGSTAAIRAQISSARPNISPSAAVRTWTDLGPRPAQGGAYVTNTGTVLSAFGNVSGRVNALAVDPTNVNVVYAATAGGGVWKTTDGGTNWAPLTDNQPTLVISSLAIDPNNHLVIYAGTGDRDGGDLYGSGVLKSIDGGANWVQLGAATFGGLRIGSMAIDRATTGVTQHVFAATDGGLFQSIDGGTTWTQNTQINTVISHPTGVTITGGLFQVIQDPAAATRFFATAADYCETEFGQVLVSNDRGVTWSVSDDFLTLANRAARVQLGVGPGGVDYVVTVQCYPSYGIYDVEKTVDGGAHWNAVPTPPDYLTSTAGGQGWYDNYVGVDPNNASRVIFGGIDVLATTDGAATYHNVGKVYTGGVVHPDQHAVAYFGPSSLFLGNDGGVYKSTNMGGTGTSSDWANLNATFGVTQFYQGSAIDSDHLIGGAQDNANPGRFAGVPGTPAAPGMLAYGGGDGGYAAIDPTPGSNTIYTSYTNGLVSKASRTAQYPSTLAAPCDEVAAPACSDPSAFIAPFLMDPSNPQHLLVGTDKVYQSTTGGLPAGTVGWPTVSPVLTTGLTGDYISAMTESGGGNVIVTGSLMGDVFLSTNTGGTWTNITGNLPAAPVQTFLLPSVSGLAVNSGNPAEIWATIGGIGASVGHIWHTTNSGTTWADISGSAPSGLPNQPALAVALDPNNSATIYVGTTNGVLVCSTCGGTSPVPAWLPVGAGLPNAMVKYLSFTADTANVVAWTFGRGVWMSPISVVALPPLRAVLPAMANGAYGGYTTAAYIQNLGSNAARVVVRYFDQSGSQVGVGDIKAALPGSASWTVRQDNGNSFASGGAGSALVYSDQPIAAFVNEFAPGNGDATSYTSIQLPAGAGTTLFAPAIANGAYGGYTTGIGLVNVGATATNLTISYRDASGTVARTQTVNNVAPNAYQGLYSGDAALALPAGFAGTATISSSVGAVAAIVNETGPGGQFSSYDAVPAGASTLSAPVALNNAFGGYNTGMAVQNTTGGSGMVSVTYYDTGGTPTTTQASIAANGYLGIYQGTDIPVAGAYTAVLTSTVAIAAIVNEVAPPGAGPARQSTSYNTFATGMSPTHLALVTNASSDGWSTGAGIMNTGAGSTTVTVSYYDAANGTPTGTIQSMVLPPHAFWGLYQPTAGLPAGVRATAVITTSGGQVAVICNESSATSFMSYGGQ